MMRKLQEGIWVRDRWEEIPSPAPCHRSFWCEVVALLLLIAIVCGFLWFVADAVSQ